MHRRRDRPRAGATANGTPGDTLYSMRARNRRTSRRFLAQRKGYASLTAFRSDSDGTVPYPRVSSQARNEFRKSGRKVRGHPPFAACSGTVLPHDSWWAKKDWCPNSVCAALLNLPPCLTRQALSSPSSSQLPSCSGSCKAGLAERELRELGTDLFNRLSRGGAACGAGYRMALEAKIRSVPFFSFFSFFPTTGRWFTAEAAE